MKRVRPRAFAILWAAPAWLRSLWQAMREGPAEAGRELERARLRSSVGRARPLKVPALRSLEAGGHACSGCGLCPEICPSRALALGTLDSGNVASEGRSVIRFELNLGACIGCARCIDECPESALVGVSAPGVLAATFAGTVRPVDLLALGEKAR